MAVLEWMGFWWAGPQKWGEASGRGGATRGGDPLLLVSHLSPAWFFLCLLLSQPGLCAHPTGPSGARTTVSACGSADNVTERTIAGMGLMRKTVVRRPVRGVLQGYLQ